MGIMWIAFGVFFLAGAAVGFYAILLDTWTIATFPVPVTLQPMDAKALHSALILALFSLASGLTLIWAGYSVWKGGRSRRWVALVP